jgi:cation/acetate symporter
VATNPGGADPASPYQSISLLVALLFGTLGLPHVLVRFYTNPDGQSARRTTLIVLGLLVRVLPVSHGVRAGRAACSPRTWPGRGRRMPWCCCFRAELVGGPAGDLLSALVVAGAFAAFLSTTSGLVVSLAGVISQDVLGGSVRGFRVAALVSITVPLGLALMTDSLALAGSVGLVFAFTASTICPVLLLGIWWRGLTDAGAIAGMVTGGLLCGGAMVAGTVLGAGNPAVAGAAGGVDRAGGLHRDGPDVAGHQFPGAADHHQGDDQAAHARAAAGYGTLTSVGQAVSDQGRR